MFSYRWPPDVLLFRETCTAARNRKESAKIEYTSQIPKCMAWRETPVTTVSSHADFQLPQAFLCYFVTVRPAMSNSHVIPLTGEGDRSETPCFVLGFFKLNYMELGKLSCFQMKQWMCTYLDKMCMKNISKKTRSLFRVNLINEHKCSNPCPQ